MNENLSPKLAWELLPQLPSYGNREGQFDYYFTSTIVVSQAVKSVLTPCVVKALLYHVRALAEQQKGLHVYQVFKHISTGQMVILTDGMTSEQRENVPEDIPHYDFVNIDLFNEVFDTWEQYTN